ncbi:hypothetical protein KJ682_09590 [bacterium]|nr:hypothetical protein [bacterium]
MQKQWIVRCRLRWFNGDETAWNRNMNRLDGLVQGGRIPLILVDDSETEAYGMEIEVLGYEMMVVPGPR